MPTALLYEAGFDVATVTVDNEETSLGGCGNRFEDLSEPFIGEGVIGLADVARGLSPISYRLCPTEGSVGRIECTTLESDRQGRGQGQHLRQ